MCKPCFMYLMYINLFNPHNTTEIGVLFLPFIEEKPEGHNG